MRARESIHFLRRILDYGCMRLLRQKCAVLKSYSEIMPRWFSWTSLSRSMGAWWIAQIKKNAPLNDDEWTTVIWTHIKPKLSQKNLFLMNEHDSYITSESIIYNFDSIINQNFEFYFFTNNRLNDHDSTRLLKRTRKCRCKANHRHWNLQDWSSRTDPLNAPESKFQVISSNLQIKIKIIFD